MSAKRARDPQMSLALSPIDVIDARGACEVKDASCDTAASSRAPRATSKRAQRAPLIPSFIPTGGEGRFHQ